MTKLELYDRANKGKINTALAVSSFGDLVLKKHELYDCTLREGEQAAGAGFTLAGRLELFTLLDEFGFDYIELGWPMTSEDIANSFHLCKRNRKKAKIVAFGSTSMGDDVTKDKNLDSILRTGADYACIYGKTPLQHVKKQLKITPQENLDKIFRSVEFLTNEMPVFYDAEHFFDAFKKNKDYALKTLLAAAKGGAERLILCDTNGGCLNDEIKKIVSQTRVFLDLNCLDVGLGLHLHDDSGLSLASNLDCLDDVVQVQGTINGTGERVGNLNFSQFIPNYILKKNKPLSVNFKQLKRLYEHSCTLAGLAPNRKLPYVGDDAFAHKAGAHIDALNKDLSYEHENPKKFGNKTRVLLSTYGGTATVVATAKNLGYMLDKKDPMTREKVKLLFEELKKYETRGYCLESIEAEQNIFIERFFGDFKDFLAVRGFKSETQVLDDEERSRFVLFGRVNNFPETSDLNSTSLNLSSRRKNHNYRVFTDLSPGANVFFENLGPMSRNHFLYRGKVIDGGPVDAAYKAMVKLVSSDYPAIADLKIAKFDVKIVNQHAEESTVRTLIGFEDGIKFETVGVDRNIMKSVVEAISKGFNYYLNYKYNPYSKLNKLGER